MYLDHNATTPVSNSVKEVIKTAQNNFWENPNSVYTNGILIKSHIKKAENTIKNHLNTKSGKVYWFQSGSLANYFATQILSDKIWDQDKLYSYFYTTNIEHKSIIEESTACKILEVDKNGKLKLNNLKKFLYTSVSCMYVNNEVGTIQPVDKIKKYQPDTVLHIDAVQALGKLKIEADLWQADMITISAHKIYGPKGIAALWVRDNVEHNIPYLGTPAYPLIKGFEQAIEDINIIDYYSYLDKQETYFLEELSKGLKEGRDFKINVSSEYRVPGTLSIQFIDFEADEMLFLLDGGGISTSTGSACNTYNTKPSHVLKAIGLSDKEAKQTIRFSFGHTITNDQVIEAAKIVAKIYKEKK